MNGRHSGEGGGEHSRETDYDYLRDARYITPPMADGSVIAYFVGVSDDVSKSSARNVAEGDGNDISTLRAPFTPNHPSRQPGRSSLRPDQSRSMPLSRLWSRRAAFAAVAQSQSGAAALSEPSEESQVVSLKTK